ncbi:hypothetical protein CFC21_037328 [Triticum aestivum]|uniref:non-specific serine/threonine protein kinase n=3 Tax=Triticum TaxID=4564 RepID=A0A9R0RVC4_TRITD|nr:hypothetical protein CFC21_037328 [Triticum aestivum]VAH67089.1 unnamed protein product [Triticum turgidum subsp. durum]
MATHAGPCFSAAVLPLLLGFLLLRGAPSRAADTNTVAVGQPLSGRKRLVSKRGKFALGFFQPAESSRHWYLGIWYNQISEHTTVWVANRDAPLSDPASSQLSISSDGNMVLLHGDRAKSPALWSTGVASIPPSSSTVGVLLDTGNLVLTDASNTSVVLWQSFDHFGDTWLPGGRLGRNKRTGEVTRLFAWKGYDDPAPGVFALELDPNGTSQYLLNWNGSMEYWTSGNWTGDGFTGVPELKAYSNSPMSMYNFGYVDGKDESHFFYDVKDEAVVTRFLVDVTGQIKFLTRRRRLKAQRRVVEGSLMPFTYRDMQSVTNNFSDKLGGGSFGSVFKGSLPDATATLVAVKKLEGVRQGEKQFRAEVSTIGTIQHVNLIRLLGFCSEGTRRLLVYEHMPNGSLDRHLFSSGPGPGHGVLSWETRYQIALGVARGLDYLHDKCRDCIIHCDIKPENILLDDAFAVKVADFGLAKLMGRDISRVLTTMRGTVGYLAPEWITGTAITAKADVFSYGMLLFEIVSGRRNVEQRPDGTVDFFPSAAASRLLDGDVKSTVDRRLDGDAEVGEVERACKVACWCVQDEEGARPSMGTVVQALEGLVDVGMPPVPRMLKVLGDPANYVKFFSGLPST